MKRVKLWRWPKKYLVLLLVLSLVAGFLIFSAANQNKTPYKFAEVKRQAIKTTISASGIINGQDNVALKFQSPGKVGIVNVKVGDRVQIGQTITTLDNQDLNIKLQQAQNTLRDKQATVDKIIDDTKQYQYGNETNSSAETYALRQARTTAEVARDNAYDSVKAAQRAFQDAIITSPISGTVVQFNGLPGQNVSTTETIAQVVDFSKIIFEADIDEADITNISLGQRAEITLNAYGDKILNGTVTKVNPFTKTTNNGAIVVTVKIDLTDSGVQPIYGLNGQAGIVTNERANVIAIPQEALRNDNTVVVQTPQGLKPVQVQTGLKSDTDVEITSGLNEGMQILTNPPPPGQNLTQNRNLIRRFIGR